jgi:hypothetical protein
MPNNTLSQSQTEQNDLFAETLLKIEATIEGSRAFLVAFLRTAAHLVLLPLRVQTLLDQSADPLLRTRPLTFMVVSVVGGSVALQTILGSLIRELVDRDRALEVPRLATEVFQAYAALSFGQVIVEALPITVLALLMTSWLFPLVKVQRGLERTLGDVVSYSIGLQFSLILLASLAAMLLMPFGASPSVQAAAGAVGWIFVIYVLVVPALILLVSLHALDGLSPVRRWAIVSVGLLISSGLVVLDVAYLLVRSAIAEALKKA